MQTEEMPPVVELVPVPDTFCSGVGAIENIGAGLLRVYLYATQGSACGEGPMETRACRQAHSTGGGTAEIMLQAKAAIGGTTAQTPTVN